MSHNELIASLEITKEAVVKESKRILKTHVPKSELVHKEVTVNLVKLYNEFIAKIRKYWSLLTEQEQVVARRIYTAIRDKIVRAFEVLKIKYKIPNSISQEIDPTITEENSSSEDEETENEIVIANSGNKIIRENIMNANEFFTFASRVLSSEFDGSPEKLLPFIDALNLLNANCVGHEQNAVAFVKTKLSGKARDLITDADNLQNIIIKLQQGIKGESSQTLASKILLVEQKSKSFAQFASEIEDLSLKLKRAYISEGVPVQIAETYSANQSVKALITNTYSEKHKIIMEAGNFKTAEEALHKFTSITAEEKPRIYDN